MAFLFQINDKVVYPNAETLLISPYKDLWERDSSDKKEFALMEFAYIEFMTSLKKSNPFKGYPEERKHEVIKEAIFKDEEWEPDELVKEAMEDLRLFQNEASLTINYFEAAKIAIEKMMSFFSELDINERNLKTGNPLFKPADITRAINDLRGNLSTFKELEKQVEEDLYDEVRTKAGKEISPFAKLDSLK